MKASPITRFLVITLLGLLALAPAAPAHAARADHEIIDLDGVVAESETFFTDQCGFRVDVHFQGSLRISYHYDRNGVLRFEVVTRGEPTFATLVNPATGKSLTSQFPVTFINRYSDEGRTNIWTGLVMRFHSPDGGLLAIEAGRVVYVYDEQGNELVDLKWGPAGPQLLDYDMEALCGMLE